MSSGVREHEFEAAHGLPEPLPTDEHVLWQGAPDWRTLAIRAFHVRKLIIYFAVILALRAAFVVSSGGTAYAATVAVLWLLPLAALAVGMAGLLAWLSSRTTAYTITDKRLVMRIGIVLTVTFNLPFRTIESADLRANADGTGDIPVKLKAPNRIAYLHLWPHARPWQLARPQPMMRAVPNAAAVAQILSAAWSRGTGTALQPAAVARPQRASEARPAMAAH